MKILHLTTLLDFGGIERKKENLSVWRDDNEWVFVSIGRGGEASRKIAENGKRVVCLDLPYRILSFQTLFKLFRFLQREKPDVLHAAGAEANFYGFVVGKLLGIPIIVVEEIGIARQSRVANLIFKYIFKNASIAIGESKVVVDTFSNRYGLTSNQAKVVPNFGIFNFDFSGIQVNKRPEEFRILLVSRLEPVKNIEGVLNVFTRLLQVSSNYKLRLLIAGTGSLDASLKERVNMLNINDQVSFLGFITNPYYHLANSDMYILNSFSEGFSNSLVEALYSATPCLSTQVGAASEIIQDGYNGFLVPVNDEQALYMKLRKIVTMAPREREEIGLRGRKTIVANFSIEKHIKELMKIYKGR